MESIKKLPGGETIEPNTTNHIPFPDEYTLHIHPTSTKTLYIFKDPNGLDAAKYKGTEPLMLTSLSTIGKEIRKHLNPTGRLSPDAVNEDFESVKQVLNELHQLHQIAQDREEEVERLQKEQNLQLKLREAQDVLESKDHPILYIASLVSWLTAGERSNIMLAFIAYASQVILRNPINVVALGEGSSGKTHIEEVALSLLPDEYVISEKKTTEPTFFRKAQQDPYFFDGKIVNLGDLGGRSSQDFVMEIKDLLKELQTDGYLSKSLLVKGGDGDFDELKLELFGNPCTTYTTVPGFVFDDQEMSRSLFITPRMDNKAVFNARKKILEFMGGRTYKVYQGYKLDANVVKYIVRLLRERMDTIIIINPYTESVINFLGESEYFKRDFDKYNGILKTITAINGYHRQTFDIDGQEVLFTNKDDIQIFISLLSVYHESISVNISPKSAEVLDTIRSNLDDWTLDKKVSDYGFTVNEFFELTQTQLSKRSIQNYFGELNRAGFLKVVGKVGASNQYQLSGRVSEDLLVDLLSISEEQEQLISWELGVGVKDFIMEDEAHQGMSILLPDESVDVPGWDRYDH